MIYKTKIKNKPQLELSISTQIDTDILIFLYFS